MDNLGLRWREIFYPQKIFYLQIEFRLFPIGRPTNWKTRGNLPAALRARFPATENLGVAGERMWGIGRVLEFLAPCKPLRSTRLHNPRVRAGPSDAMRLLSESGGNDSSTAVLAVVIVGIFVVVGCFCLVRLSSGKDQEEKAKNAKKSMFAPQPRPRAVEALPSVVLLDTRED